MKQLIATLIVVGLIVPTIALSQTYGFKGRAMCGADPPHAEWCQWQTYDGNPTSDPPGSPIGSTFNSTQAGYFNYAHASFTANTTYQVMNTDYLLCCCNGPYNKSYDGTMCFQVTTGESEKPIRDNGTFYDDDCGWW